MHKVRFLYNPSSGETIISEWLDQIIHIYQERGYLLQPYRLEFGLNQEEQMFSGVDDSFHHLLVAGGDGTVNYVINQMKRQGLDLPVGILPTGTANDFAYTLGIPNDLSKACRVLLEGEIERVDLGKINHEYFVNVFSCGLFTEVSQKTPTYLKNTFGKMAYYFGGLGELPNFRKMQISIQTDVGDYEGSSLIFFVFNGRTAGQMRLAHLSEINDGLLDILVVKGDSPVETIQTIIHFIRTNAPIRSKNRNYPAGVVHLQAREIMIQSQKRERTDIDGQPGPDFPIQITCEAGALQLLRPAIPPRKVK